MSRTIFRKLKNITVTTDPPTNKTRWKLSGFAMGPTTVTARIIFADYVGVRGMDEPNSLSGKGQFPVYIRF